MKKQVVIIHGGTVFETKKGYLDYLRNREMTLEKLRRQGWKDKLPDDLGGEYDVLFPNMPNASDARYAEWKITFDKIMPLLESEAVFVGHSLGATFLIKYFSESDASGKAKALLLVAGAHDPSGDEPLLDFALGDLSRLAKLGNRVFLYHSQDDPVVPFANFEAFRRELPEATARIFADRGHFNLPEFPEIAEDIRNAFGR